MAFPEQGVQGKRNQSFLFDVAFHKDRSSKRVGITMVVSAKGQKSSIRSYM